MKIAIIVALAKNNIIGADNTIPWYCPEDLKYFKRTTLGSPVLMGRKTYESLKVKPLPGRHNIIVTRGCRQYQGCHSVASIEEGIALAESITTEKLFIIGGADIYQQSLSLAHQLYVTEIDVEVDGDCFFPSIDASQWSLIRTSVYPADDSNPHTMTFKVFSREK